MINSGDDGTGDETEVTDETPYAAYAAIAGVPSASKTIQQIKDQIKKLETRLNDPNTPQNQRSPLRDKIANLKKALEALQKLQRAATGGTPSQASSTSYALLQARAVPLDLAFQPRPSGQLASSSAGRCDPSLGVSYFVVDHLDAFVARVASCSGTELAVIPVPSLPLQVEVTPDGSLALVASYSSAITFIDTGSNAVVATLNTDPNVHPSGIAITSDGTRAYVTNFYPLNPSVLVVDIAKRAIVANINVTEYPTSVFLSPDDSTAWVTHVLDNKVTIIDTLTNTVTGALTVPSPFAVEFNPTGTRAYIDSGPQTGNGTVQVIDTDTLATLASIPVGNRPVDMLMEPDGRFLFVENYGSGTISQISTKTNQVYATIPVGPFPLGLGFTR